MALVPEMSKKQFQAQAETQAHPNDFLTDVLTDDVCMLFGIATTSLPPKLPLKRPLDNNEEEGEEEEETATTTTHKHPRIMFVTPEHHYFSPPMVKLILEERDNLKQENQMLRENIQATNKQLESVTQYLLCETRKFNQMKQEREQLKQRVYNFFNKKNILSILEKIKQNNQD